MARKILIRSREHVYHITTRTNGKENFYLPLPEVWSFCCELLRQASVEMKIELHAFVLMSNHYHMLIRTPECDIDKFMHYFNKKLSMKINKHARRINHVFGGPYHWSLIHDRAYYHNALKYVYLNPVRAGLSDFVENYRYSSLHPHAALETKCWESISLKWINQQYSNEDSARIRLGLKKKYFRPRPEKSTRRNIAID